MKTKTTLANTKLKVHDYVKHIDDDIRYRVVYDYIMYALCCSLPNV
jgi:hypothetical protein